VRENVSLDLLGRLVAVVLEEADHGTGAWERAGGTAGAWSRCSAGKAWQCTAVPMQQPAMPGPSAELGAGRQRGSEWLLSDVGLDVGTDVGSDVGQLGCARKKGSPHCARAPTPIPFGPDTLHIVYKDSATCFGAANAR
jgi:hypothetical protein